MTVKVGLNGFLVTSKLSLLLCIIQYYTIEFISTRVWLVIGVKESLMVSIDCSCHSWEWLLDAQVTSNIVANHQISLRSKKTGK